MVHNRLFRSILDYFTIISSKTNWDFKFLLNSKTIHLVWVCEEKILRFQDIIVLISIEKKRIGTLVLNKNQIMESFFFSFFLSSPNRNRIIINQIENKFPLKCFFCFPWCKTIPFEFIKFEAEEKNKSKNQKKWNFDIEKNSARQEKKIKLPGPNEPSLLMMMIIIDLWLLSICAPPNNQIGSIDFFSSPLLEPFRLFGVWNYSVG